MKICIALFFMLCLSIPLHSQSELEIHGSFVYKNPSYSYSSKWLKEALKIYQTPGNYSTILGATYAYYWDNNGISLTGTYEFQDVEYKDLIVFRDPDEPAFDYRKEIIRLLGVGLSYHYRLYFKHRRHYFDVAAGPAIWYTIQNNSRVLQFETNTMENLEDTFNDFNGILYGFRVNPSLAWATSRKRAWWLSLGIPFRMMWMPDSELNTRLNLGLSIGVRRQF